MELPVLTTAPVERADAARNRRQILSAAERLFAQRGVQHTSMEAIATEAGVGKGTLFRRFGDRSSLALAVLDSTERRLQDAILRGPPPLGPGAPPPERLIAFGAAMLDRLQAHGDLLLVAENATRGSWMRSPPYAMLWLHVHALVEQAQAGGDLDYLTDILLGALSAQTFDHQYGVRGMTLVALKGGYGRLVERVLGAHP